MNPKTKLIIIIAIIIFMIAVLIRNIAYGKDRCQDYLPEIRNAALLYLGPSYPYWYNIGCAINESSCRSNLVSFDGGIGIFQFTPSTGVTEELKRHGLSINPYDIDSSIKGQAFYIKIIKDNKMKVNKISIGKSKNPGYPAKFTENCGNNLADYYRFYNGGYWFVYESGRKNNHKSFICSNDEMRKYCVRGGTYTDKAKTKWLSFCDVNYSYPEKVYNYGKKYSNGLPDQQRFWYNKDKNNNDKNNKNNKETPKSLPVIPTKPNLKPNPNPNSKPIPTIDDKDKNDKVKPLDSYMASLISIIVRDIKPFAN